MHHPSIFWKVPDVSTAYWDETSEDSLKHGIPASLTKEEIELGGEESSCGPSYQVPHPVVARGMRIVNATRDEADSSWHGRYTKLS